MLRSLNFCFNKIHDCVVKAPSTAANQDRVSANSQQLSSSFDLVPCSAKRTLSMTGENPNMSHAVDFFYIKGPVV